MKFNFNILIILLFLLLILCLNKEGMEVEGDSGLLETLKGYFEGLFETLFPGDKKVDDVEVGGSSCFFRVFL